MEETSMKHKTLPATGGAAAPSENEATINKNQVLGLLRRLDGAPASALPAVPGTQMERAGPPALSAEDRMNAAIGCKTSEVALAILVQVVKFENPDRGTPQAAMDAHLMKATALLAELQPTTATETLLAAQMIGTQRVAMAFLHLAMQNGQTHASADANVLRATRLMRVFNEQVETMAKLKGKSGQQRVVVEHVTVNDGGQAIVGAVAATKTLGVGGGSHGEN
jgi:hypothetical protein